MKTIKLTLKEDENLDIVDDTNIEDETTDTDIEQSVEDNSNDEIEDEKPSFIVSDELNEIRDILLDIPDEIEILLLNDDLVVLGTVVDTETFLYTLPENAEDFTLIKMPLKIQEIFDDPNVIKYQPHKVDDRHNKVVDLLMSKLESTEEVI